MCRTHTYVNILQICMAMYAFVCVILRHAFLKVAPINDNGGSIRLVNVSMASAMLNGASRRILAS